VLGPLLISIIALAALAKGLTGRRRDRVAAAARA
jgi:hypothetical protein